ncbi:MAG: Nif3-like dinuclear metal center hexameric protein [Phycisphaerae bacterium]
MSERPQSGPECTVGDICTAMESIAPTGLAQSWDNVGLLAGDPSAPVQHVLACIDLTPAVVEEAVREKVDLVLAYHPPIFKPISKVRADGSGTEAIVFRCIQNGIAVYATHTALDAADGGTNDVIASLCGVEDTAPIEYVDEPSVSECKLVVFVPPDNVETVADAMFAAGAGQIGDYSRCSYRTSGQGTFFGGNTAKPTIGERGRMEYADEIRLETVVASTALPAVVSAMVKAHPYEEPAFDLYPLKPRPVRGIGRVGKLPRLTTLLKLVRKLKRATKIDNIQIIGPPDRTIDRAVIVVGAGVPHVFRRGDAILHAESGSPTSKEMGHPPFHIPLGPNDVIITGEIRHHDALTIQRIGCTAIALGHWASERPVLPSLAARLEAAVPGITLHISSADDDPFQAI